MQAILRTLSSLCPLRWTLTPLPSGWTRIRISRGILTVSQWDAPPAVGAGVIPGPLVPTVYDLAIPGRYGAVHRVPVTVLAPLSQVNPEAFCAAPTNVG
jgi:hypothetical protein